MTAGLMTAINTLKRRGPFPRRFPLSGLLRPGRRNSVPVIPALIETGLVLALAWILIRLAWVLAVPGHLGPWPAGEGPLAAYPAQNTEADYSVLLSSNPFAAGASPARVAQQNTRAPETSLNLVLAGIRAGAGNEGAAIIRTPDNRQGLYRTGDEIVTGVRLTAVMPGRAILSKSGVLESLSLVPERDRLSEPGGPADSATVQSAAAITVPELADLFSAIDMRAYRIDGRIRGFRLVEEEGGNRLAAIGLQSGDILVSVNGTAMVSAERLEELSEELAGAETLEITLERDGRHQTLTLPVRQDT